MEDMKRSCYYSQGKLHTKTRKKEDGSIQVEMDKTMCMKTEQTRYGWTHGGDDDEIPKKNTKMELKNEQP